MAKGLLIYFVATIYIEGVRHQTKTFDRWMAVMEWLDSYEETYKPNKYSFGVEKLVIPSRL